MSKKLKKARIAQKSSLKMFFYYIVVVVVVVVDVDADVTS